MTSFCHGNVKRFFFGFDSKLQSNFKLVDFWLKTSWSFTQCCRH